MRPWGFAILPEGAVSAGECHPHPTSRANLSGKRLVADAGLPSALLVDCGVWAGSAGEAGIGIPQDADPRTVLRQSGPLPCTPLGRYPACGRGETVSVAVRFECTSSEIRVAIRWPDGGPAQDRGGTPGWEPWSAPLYVHSAATGVVTPIAESSTPLADDRGLRASPGSSVGIALAGQCRDPEGHPPCRMARSRLARWRGCHGPRAMARRK
jgi:hypothetical protein